MKKFKIFTILLAAMLSFKMSAFAMEKNNDDNNQIYSSMNEEQDEKVSKNIETFLSDEKTKHEQYGEYIVLSMKYCKNEIDNVFLPLSKILIEMLENADNITNNRLEISKILSKMSTCNKKLIKYINSDIILERLNFIAKNIQKINQTILKKIDDMQDNPKEYLKKFKHYANSIVNLACEIKNIIDIYQI